MCATNNKYWLIGTFGSSYELPIPPHISLLVFGWHGRCMREERRPGAQWDQCRHLCKWLVVGTPRTILTITSRPPTPRISKPNTTWLGPCGGRWRGRAWHNGYRMAEASDATKGQEWCIHRLVSCVRWGMEVLRPPIVATWSHQTWLTNHGPHLFRLGNLRTGQLPIGTLQPNMGAGFEPDACCDGREQ